MSQFYFFRFEVDLPLKFHYRRFCQKHYKSFEKQQQRIGQKNGEVKCQ